MDQSVIKEIAKCCISDKPMISSGHINIIALDFMATWKFPIFGNHITNDWPRAVAYIHDDCIDAEGHLIGVVKYAIEFSDTDIIYHPVEELLTPTFQCGQIGDDVFIKCKICGLKSFNVNDIQQKYCGYCRSYHYSLTQSELERARFRIVN